MEPERLKANSHIIFGRRHIAKDSILIVGQDITEAEAAALKSMGKEISVLDDSRSPSLPPSELADLMDTLEGFKKELADLAEQNCALHEENQVLVAANKALTEEIDALKASAQKTVRKKSETENRRESETAHEGGETPHEKTGGE